MFLRTILALTLPLVVVNISQSAAGNTNDDKFEEIVFIEDSNIETDIFTNKTQPIIITSNYLHNVRVPKTVQTPEMYWPVEGKEITGRFGHRSLSCEKCSSYHEGIDFSRSPGTPVYAALDGLVTKIEYGGEYGLYIYIDHVAVINTKEERWTTVYAHLKKDSIPENIKVGGVVNGGDLIGGVGNTGLSTGPHLHFELRIEGEKVNPEKYLIMYAN